jgi:hypothetical protein
MKKSCFTEAQITGILRQMENGVPARIQTVPRTRHEQRDSLQVARQVWVHGCVQDEPDEVSGGREPPVEAHVC